MNEHGAHPLVINELKRVTKHEQSVHTFNTTPSQVTPHPPKWPHTLSPTSLMHQGPEEVLAYTYSCQVKGGGFSKGHTCHTTASHLIEHTHTHRAILHQHRNRRKCSPSLTWSHHSECFWIMVTLLTVPRTMTFTLHLVNTLRGT